MIELIIVDDHDIVRQGLRTLLEFETEIKIVAEASNGVDALNQISKLSPDVILLDINMPRMDGIECCKILKNKYDHLNVIALTMYKEMDYLNRMMEAGADGYLLKSCSKSELLKAINVVDHGGRHISEEMRDSHSHIENRRTSNCTNRISKREQQVLQLISEECTTVQIASELYLSVATVETHRKNMLRKLGLKNTAGLMRYAFENKLVH